MNLISKPAIHGINDAYIIFVLLILIKGFTKFRKPFFNYSYV